MAKQTQKTTVKEKKKNPVLRIMLTIFILFMIVIIAFFGFLYFSDFSISKWAKESDSFVANLIDSDDETNASEEIEESKEDPADISNDQETLAEKDEEIDYLMSVIEDLEFTMLDLEQEILRLENNLANDPVEDVDEEPTQGASQVKRLAQSYEEMDSDRAAAIFAAMTDAEAGLILQEVATDVRGEILQEMEAEHAARLSLLLMEE